MQFSNTHSHTYKFTHTHSQIRQNKHLGLISAKFCVLSCKSSCILLFSSCLSMVKSMYNQLLQYIFQILSEMCRSLHQFFKNCQVSVRLFKIWTVAIIAGWAGRHIPSAYAHSCSNTISNHGEQYATITSAVAINNCDMPTHNRTGISSSFWTSLTTGIRYDGDDTGEFSPHDTHTTKSLETSREEL